jgi:twitching motility protein PilT
MRDRETIQIALEASETGHLVLSTLHTIDAAKTYRRSFSFGRSAGHFVPAYQKRFTLSFRSD